MESPICLSVYSSKTQDDRSTLMNRIHVVEAVRTEHDARRRPDRFHPGRQSAKGDIAWYS